MAIALLVAGSFGVLAIWIGYPTVIAWRARSRSLPPASAPRHWPLVSVIVATRESADLVQARVDDARAGAYPADRLEIVLGVERASWGATGAAYAGLRGARAVVGDEPGGKACNLNAAVRAASGDVLVFTDSAQRFDTGAIPALVRALHGGTHDIVSGALDAGGARNDAGLVARYWRMERALRADEAKLHSSIGVTGAVYAMWRERWHPLPQGLILDDLYVPMRAVLDGARVGFEPVAKASDARVFAVAQEYRRKVRTLTGLYQLCTLMPDVLSPSRNPVFWPFVFHKLLRMATPALVLMALAGGTLGVRDLATRQLGLSSLQVALGLLGALLLVLAVPGLRRLLWTGLTMQRAIVSATWNALRGQWEVW